MSEILQGAFRIWMNLFPILFGLYSDIYSNCCHDKMIFLRLIWAKSCSRTCWPVPPLSTTSIFDHSSLEITCSLKLMQRYMMRWCSSGGNDDDGFADIVADCDDNCGDIDGDGMAWCRGGKIKVAMKSNHFKNISRFQMRASSQRRWSITWRFLLKSTDHHASLYPESTCKICYSKV